MKTPRKTRKGVEDRYMAFLNHVHDVLNQDEKVNLNEIAKLHRVSKSLCPKLRRIGIIRYTLKGNEWVGDKPTLELANDLLMVMRKEAIENNRKRKAKQEQQPQQLFEWQKPQPTVNIEPKYEFTPQPDTSSVSEFIDHHEQSLLPPPIKRVKTPKNDKKERLFQLRIFGINLFTVKY